MRLFLDFIKDDFYNEPQIYIITDLNTFISELILMHLIYHLNSP